MDENKIPMELPDVGGRSFLWVFENRQEFVDWTIHDMKCPTGFFKTWQDYCLLKIKASLKILRGGL